MKLPDRLKHVEAFIKRPRPVGYVYIIRCQGFIKVGVADDPYARLVTLQTGNPFKLELMRFFASIDPYAEERELHELLRNDHERLEWFRLTPKLEAVINKL